MKGQRGFTYLALLVIIVILGIVLMAAGRQWRIIVKRDKEEELLFRGGQMRKAVEMHYLTLHGGKNIYPKNLEDLVKDPSSFTAKRYLRKIYKDPITGEDWVLLLDKDGRIKGVRSKSDEEPLKKYNFPPEFQSFEGKIKYSDWLFEYTPAPPQPPVPPKTQPK